MLCECSVRYVLLWTLGDADAEYSVRWLRAKQKQNYIYHSRDVQVYKATNKYQTSPSLAP